MYSRKFGQNSLPPDYGGVSFRRDDKDSAPSLQTPPDPPERTAQYPPYPPQYSPELPRQERPKRNIKLKRGIHGSSEPKEIPKEEPSFGCGSLAKRSFTMEDIVLAGLILLLLNSDCDSELLLILGFLLLVGLQ